jgi:glucosamine--fructose-6-phosphate aminotransferase (isomerizing)
MRRNVYQLPELMKQQYSDLEPKTRKLLSTPEIFSLQKIILLGCGDSYAAGMATKSAFEHLTKLPVEVVTAMDGARYLPSNQIGNAPNTPLLIAVSNSGAVARVVEAVMRINHYGGFTVGITGKSDSLLANNASRVLKLDIPPFEDAPGISTYMVSVLSLLLLAIRIGEVRGNYSMDEANLYRKEIETSSFFLEANLSAIDDEAYEIASEWKECTGFDFIGAGPDFAAAWYGHAKILEAAGRHAMHVNTEEWLHLNFFIRDAAKTAAVLVIDQKAPSLSRALEVAEHIVKVGRPFVIISNAPKSIFPKQAHCIVIPQCEYPWMSPITQYVPLALMAGYIGAMLGEEYGRGGKDNWAASQNGAATKESQIVVV